ncbi:MAG: TrkA family potassium uptake protein [Bdellovibrionales bacterium]|nr:TrkA family potassium uptake protein [Bdellovibrionales bacterium]
MKIAEAIVRPHVMKFLDLATGSTVDLEIEEIKIPPGSPISGMSLQEAELRIKTNVNVAAVINESGEMVFSPGGDTVLHDLDALIVMGKKSDLEKLETLLVSGS